MNSVAWLEVCATPLAAALLLRGVAQQTHEHPRPARLLFSLLLGLLTLIHAIDVLEWAGFPALDAVGDNLRVLVPLLWLIALFARHREELTADLDARHKQLMFLLEQGPLAVCIFELGGRVLEVSAYWATRAGVSATDCRGVDFRELPGVPQKLLQDVLSKLDAGGPRVASVAPLSCVWGNQPEWVEWQAHASPGMPLFARQLHPESGPSSPRSTC